MLRFILLARDWCKHFEYCLVALVAWKHFNDEEVVTSLGKYLRDILAAVQGAKIFRLHAVHGASPERERAAADPFRWVDIGILGIIIFVPVHNEHVVGTAGAGGGVVAPHKARLS